MSHPQNEAFRESVHEAKEEKKSMAKKMKFTPWHKEAKEGFKNRKAPEGIGYGESKEHKKRWAKYYKTAK